jgi:hypothetical protein
MITSKQAIKSIPIWVWAIPVVLLVVATARLPYGYYTFTRTVTSGAAALIAFVGLRERPGFLTWATLLILIVVLFNPFVPVRLNRSTWFYLDLATAGVFTAHLFLVRQRTG